MIKLAKIVYIDSDIVTLKLEQKAQCSDCKSRCSDGFLGFLFNKKNQGVLSVAINQKDVSASHLIDEHNFFRKQHKKNDVIGLNFNETEMFKMALILYGLPILLFIIMLFLGYYLFQIYHLNSDLGGIIGLVVGMILSRFLILSIPIKIKPKVDFFN